MSLPTCSECGKRAAFAVLIPSEAACRTVAFSCARRHGHRGYYVALADLASVLPHLGDDGRTRRAGHLLTVALLDSARLTRTRAASQAARVTTRGAAA